MIRCKKNAILRGQHHVHALELTDICVRSYNTTPFTLRQTKDVVLDMAGIHTYNMTPAGQGRIKSEVFEISLNKM